jgi:hypothetical protein
MPALLRTWVRAIPSGATRYPKRRILILIMLLLLSIALYILLIRVTPRPDGRTTSFLQVWMLSFLPYFGACAFVLVTKPLAGRWFWIELSLIFLGALIFRFMLLPLLPMLSRDSWRYLWDARVTLHGYSPYVYAPKDKVLEPLRDALIFENMRYRNVPALYPPGAQGIFILSYLLAPNNLFFLKGIFLLFDMLTCGLLVLYLARKQLDMRRVIIYAWCPIPIVEFVIQGHLDATTIMFMVASVLCSSSIFRGSRALTGFLLGMATLTKIYPILLLLVLLRRRDWALPLTCFATIFMGYLPFLILGHGQVFGFFFDHANQQSPNAGIIQQVGHWLSVQFALKLSTTPLLEHTIDLIALSAISLAILVLRLKERIGVEMGALLLVGTALSISSYLFPWYTPAFLPWVAVLVGPLMHNQESELGMGVQGAKPLAGARGILTLPGGQVIGGAHPGDDEAQVIGAPAFSPFPKRWGDDALNILTKIRAKDLAVATAWYFICASMLGYFFGNTLDWSLYYLIVYGVVVLGLGIAAMVGIARWHQQHTVSYNQAREGAYEKKSSRADDLQP